MENIKRNIKSIVEKYREKTAKECYKLVAVDNVTPFIMEDKLGGMPYIPKGQQIPRDTKGNYMALLLQVNLKNIHLKNFPQNGILEIFASSEIDFPQEYKIIVFPDNQMPELELPFVDTENFFVTEPIKIELQKDTVHMPLQDYRSTDTLNEILIDYGAEIESVYDLDEDILNALTDAIDTRPATIGGYPDFTQEDPRTYDDDRDYCLFKLDSLFDRNIYIGDSGILTVTISEDYLKTEKWNEAVLDWDCC